QAQALSRPWFFPFLAPLRWAPCNKGTLYGEMLRIQEIRSIAFIYSPLVHQQVTHRHANDRALWLLEVADHVRPHRRAVDRAVGGAARRRWIGVREDHNGDGEAVNTIVAVDLRQAGQSPGQILVSGHDFVSAPRLSPDGRRLIWLAWDHPNMPWNGTMLYLAELDDTGNVTAPQAIAGGVAESIFQPEWSPDG